MTCREKKESEIKGDWCAEHSSEETASILKTPTSGFHFCRDREPCLKCGACPVSRLLCVIVLAAISILLDCPGHLKIFMKHITPGSSNSFHHESEAVCEIKYIEVQSSVLLWGENEKKRGNPKPPIHR